MIKRFFNKIVDIFIRIWKKIDKDDVLTPLEKTAFDIFKTSLYDKNNIRYLNSNDSNKKYIVSKRYILEQSITTFIILEGNRLTIVNHEYKYDIDMPDKTAKIMDSMLNDKVNEDREEMEKEILSNIKTSLDIVLSDFKENLNDE